MGQVAGMEEECEDIEFEFVVMSGEGTMSLYGISLQALFLSVLFRSFINIRIIEEGVHAILDSG